MKINWKSILLSAATALMLSGGWVIADYNLTAGVGTTIFSFTCFTTKVCPAGVQVNSAGTEIFTVAAPAHVTVDNANPNGQATMANSSPVVIPSNQTAFPINPSPTSSSSLALTTVTCGSAVSSCVLKASAGNFYGTYANCTSACWVMVFNATSLPINGATTAGSASGNLVECFEVAAGQSKSLAYNTYPRAFSVGITVAISSTACATLTASTVGFISGGVL